VALAPVAAVIFMKSRRSIVSSSSIVTGHTIDGDASLLVTTDAKFHRVFHGSRRDSHVSNIAVAGRAVYLRLNMRSMVESNMRLFRPSKNTLPRNVLALVVIGANLLDFSVVRKCFFVASPASSDIGN